MTGTRNPEATFQHMDQTLRYAFDQLKKEIRLSMPGIVRAYDRGAQQATVQPAIDVIMADGTSIPRSLLVRVPVQQPSGGGFTAHFPVRAGDAVTLLWSDRSLQDFKTRRQCAPPPYPDILPATDCVAFPGWAPNALALAGAADSFVLQSTDGAVYLELAGDALTLRVGDVRLELTTTGLTARVGTDTRLVLGASDAVLRVDSETEIALTPTGITLSGQNVTVRTNNYTREMLT